jgi:hypothetical protein
VVRVKNQHENKLSIVEIRMLCWMCGKTRQNRIKNDDIRYIVGVVHIVEKMVETRLT